MKRVLLFHKPSHRIGKAVRPLSIWVSIAPLLSSACSFCDQLSAALSSALDDTSWSFLVHLFCLPQPISSRQLWACFPSFCLSFAAFCSSLAVPALDGKEQPTRPGSATFRSWKRHEGPQLWQVSDSWLLLWWSGWIPVQDLYSQLPLPTTSASSMISYTGDSRRNVAWSGVWLCPTNVNCHRVGQAFARTCRCHNVGRHGFVGQTPSPWRYRGVVLVMSFLIYRKIKLIELELVNGS